MGLIDNFLQAYMATHEMQNRQRREEQQLIHQSVQDALDQERLRQNEQYRKDSLKSQDELRKAQIAEKASMEQHRLDELDRLKAKDEADKAEAAAKEKTANRRITQQAMGNWASGKSSETRKAAQMNAGMLPEEMAPLNTGIMQSRNEGITRQNMEIAGKNLFSLFGGMGQQESFKQPYSLSEIENEVSPAYQNSAANIQSQIQSRAISDHLKQAQDEKLRALLPLQEVSERAHAKYITQLATRQEMQNQHLPIEWQDKHLKAAGDLVNDRVRLELDRIRTNAYSSSVSSQNAARADGMKMAKFLLAESRDLNGIYKSAAAAEAEGAKTNREVGNLIAQLEPIVAQTAKAAANRDADAIKNLPSLQAKLAEYQAIWNANNLPAPTNIQHPDGTWTTEMIKPLALLSRQREEAERKLKEAKDLSMEAAGVFTKVPTKGGALKPLGKTGTYPRVSTVAEAMALPPGTKFYDPQGNLKVR